MRASRLPNPTQITFAALVTALALAAVAPRPKASPAIASAPQDPPAARGWTPGKGWGWVWGPDDEVGSLNAMSPASRAAALRLATRGDVYDLGLTYSRHSYKFPGHSPGEIITYRSPEGLERASDPAAAHGPNNPANVYWHSCALFISDNVATQIDGLAHITAGPDHHWYNGFKEADWGGDFGVRKCDATTIPPIVARGVMIDVAAHKNVDALPAHYPISAQDLKDALAAQNLDIQPGDVVLVRTGAARYWGDEGADHAKIAEHDSAGCTLEATRWLVETKGAIMVGSDTSGYEVSPPADAPGEAIPVHKYLLVDQGVHIAEFHNLEQLSRDRVHEFCYVAMVNKIKGAVAGTAMRPIAMR